MPMIRTLDGGEIFIPDSMLGASATNESEDTIRAREVEAQRQNAIRAWQAWEAHKAAGGDISTFADANVLNTFHPDGTPRTPSPDGFFDGPMPILAAMGGAMGLNSFLGAGASAGASAAPLAEAAAPAWMSNAPAGSVFAQSAGVPSLGLGADLGAGLGGNMLTTGLSTTPWYAGIGASSGLGPLATGQLGTTGLGGGATIPAPAGGGVPPVPAPKGILDQVTDAAKKAAPFAPLMGAALGAGAGALGGSNQAGTITVEEGIPDWLKPYVKPALDKYSTDIQNLNTDPYGIMPAAYQEFLNTVQGNYLDPSTNKWLPEYFRLGAERVKGTLSPSFGHMQAFGSNSGYNEALSRGLSDLAVGLYGGAYEKERDRQNAMVGAAPNFLTSASQSSFAPYIDYLGAVGGLGRKKDQPYFDQGPFKDILGGAFVGAGLGNMFK